MTRDGDVLRAAADAMPETSDPRGWLCARAHELDQVGRLDQNGTDWATRGNLASLRGMQVDDTETRYETRSQP